MGRVLRTECGYKCHNLLAIAAIDMIIMVLWTSRVAEAKLGLSEGLAIHPMRTLRSQHPHTHHHRHLRLHRTPPAQPPSLPSDGSGLSPTSVGGSHAEGMLGFDFPETSDNSTDQTIHNSSPSSTRVGVTKLDMIPYNGGPIINSDITVYPIYYGRLWTAAQRGMVASFIRSISDSSMAEKTPSVHQWWNTIRQYSDANGSHVSGQVAYGGDTLLWEPLTSVMGGVTNNTLQGDDMKNLIWDQITAGSLPADSNAMYLFLTDPTIKVPGFCRLYCGWHTTMPNRAIPSSPPLQLAFIGNPMSQCSYGCSTSWIKPPNRDTGIDSMLSVIAHEMAEMASDPFSSAWVNDTSADSSEIGDICSWEFGTSYKTSDGRDFTLLGSDASSFFIQQIWNRFEGRCVASTVIPPNVCGGQYDGFPCPQNGTCSASGFCIRSKNIQPPTNPPPLPHPPPPPLPSPSPSPPPPSIPAPTPSAGISIVPKKKRRRHRRHLIANSNVFQPLRG